ncbi:cell wall hydrolase [Bosea sp. RAF48]|uniref:cell wall hydrolase n=1 Tax=Bosea sp. RAF48 TaxID=3237480 RepID=UPI003F8F3BB0
MKRIVPQALLALAALVVLPTKTLPTTSPALSHVPFGVDERTLGFHPKALASSRLLADDFGLFGRPDSSLLVLSIVHGPGGKWRNSLARALHDSEKSEQAPPGAAQRSGEGLGKNDGTTPRPAASAAQTSVTPTSESTAIAWVTPTGFIVVPGKEPEPRQIYVGLIEPEHLEREERCLAQAVYFEARSEVEEGRAAVAQVVLNRVKSGVYPATICGVVFQNRHRKLACQFTFACEGKALRITEPEAWKAAMRIAREVYEGKTYLLEVGAAMHYHADYVQPGWAKKLKKMDVIGRHIFYS